MRQIAERCTPDAPPSDPASLLEHAVRTVSRRTIMLVVLEDIDLDDDVVALLRRLRTQHELLVLTVADLDVSSPELVGRQIRSVDSGARLPWFVTADAQLGAELAAQADQRVAARKATLDRLGVASAQVSSEEDALAGVITVLERHRDAA